MTETPIRFFRIQALGISGLALLLSALSFAGSSCKGKPEEPKADSSALISDDFYKPEEPTIQVIEEPQEPPKKHRHRSSNSHSNSSNHGRRSSADLKIQTDQPRSGDSPIDFARAVQWRLVGMLYSDPCRIVGLQVVSSEETADGRLNITVELRWEDKWIRNPYQIQGLLNVGKDGSAAVFTIQSKNIEAEALELGIDNYSDTLEIGNI